MTPLAPLAIKKTESLVEHSPSTVIALKVSSVTSARARWRRAGAIAASVVRKPSIVAIIGSIIPAPFTMPPTAKSPAELLTRSAASFGRQVGRHDRFCCGATGISAEHPDRVLEATRDLVNVEMETDDAGRGDERMLDRTSDRPRRDCRHLLRRGHPYLSGTRVCTSTVVPRSHARCHRSAPDGRGRR